MWKFYKTKRFNVWIQLFWAFSTAQGQIVLSEICPDNQSVLQDTFGNYSDWIELMILSDLNTGKEGLFLTDDPGNPRKWALPSAVLSAATRKLVFASNNASASGSEWHSNFQLNKTGEFVGVWSDRQKIWLDSIRFIAIPENYTYSKNERGIWFCTSHISPGEPNPGDLNDGDCNLDPPLHSHKSGYYGKPFELALSGVQENAQIYFTLDGSEPNPNSFRYTVPLIIQKNTVVKAATSPDGKSFSTFISLVFIFDQKPSGIPVVHISTNPEWLFSDSTGIFAKGPNASSEFPYYGANFWKDTAVRCQLSYWDEMGNEIFNERFDIGIHGGKSARTQPMKPLNVFAKEKYQFPLIPYSFFSPADTEKKYKRFVLRNAGSDFNKAHLRDGFIGRLVNDLNIKVDAPDYKPAVVYINGDYWGLMEIREKNDPYFPFTRYGITPNKINFLEDDTIVIEGSRHEFDSIYLMVRDFGVDDPERLKSLASVFDLDGFMDYVITESYFNNWDWPGNNVKYWKEQQQGKWRYILFDMDVSLNAFPWAYHTESNLHRILGTAFDSNKHMTILRALLKNQEFRTALINRYADLMNTAFLPGELERRLEKLRNLMEPEMKRHFAKWGSSVEEWKGVLEKEVHQFIVERPAYAFEFVKTAMKLDAIHQLELESFPRGVSSIELNSLKLQQQHFSGKYFQGNAISVYAKNYLGYEFKYWKINEDSLMYSNPLKLDLTRDTKLVAVYEENENLPALELLPNPAVTFSTIQFYSTTSENEVITVYDFTGRVVEKIQYITAPGLNIFRLDLSRYLSGAYLLRRNKGAAVKLVVR